MPDLHDDHPPTALADPETDQAARSRGTMERLMRGIEIGLEVQDEQAMERDKTF